MAKAYYKIFYLGCLCLLFVVSPITQTYCKNDLSWQKVTSPTTSSLHSIFMVSSNDGWAVGDNGTVLHWNGLSWSIVNIPSIVSFDLASVFMVNSNDGWIVGDYGVMLRWDGKSWNMVSSPLGTNALVGLNSVFMLNSDDGWIVGGKKESSAFKTKANGVILHWDGERWSRVWLLETSARLKQFNSVFMLSSNDGWAVGDNGSDSCIVHWNGKSWYKASGYRHGTLFSIFMVNTNDVWAVGGDLWRPAILHCDEGTWNTVSSPANLESCYFFSVFMVNSSDGWIVGSCDGTILHWDGKSLSEVSNPTTNSLHSIFMLDSNDGWIVGGQGTILRYSRPTTPTASPTSTATTPHQSFSLAPLTTTTTSTEILPIPSALFFIIIGFVAGFLFHKALAHALSKYQTRKKVAARPSEPETRTSLVLEYDRLNTELEATKQKLTKLTNSHDGGIVPEDAYGTLKNKYEKRISQLEKSIDEIWPLKHPMAAEYESLSAELENIKQKTTKLTDSYAGGSISEEAYITLLADYEKRLSDLKRIIDELEAKIKGELSLLQEEELRATKELELLSAKQTVGDIPETEYIAEKSSLDSRLTEIRRRRSSLTYPIVSQGRELSSKPS